MANVTRSTHNMAGLSTLDISWVAGDYHKIEIFFHGVSVSSPGTTYAYIALSDDGGTSFTLGDISYTYQQGQTGSGGLQQARTLQNSVEFGWQNTHITGVIKLYGMDRNDFGTVLRLVDGGSSTSGGQRIGWRTGKSQENAFRIGATGGGTQYFTGGYITVLRWAIDPVIDLQTFNDYDINPQTYINHLVPTGSCLTEHVWSNTGSVGSGPHVLQFSSDMISFDSTSSNYQYGRGTYLINTGAYPDPGTLTGMALGTTAGGVGYFEIYGMDSDSDTVATGSVGNTGGGYYHETYVSAHTVSAGQQGYRATRGGISTITAGQLYITSYGGVT